MGGWEDSAGRLVFDEAQGRGKSLSAPRLGRCVEYRAVGSLQVSPPVG